MKYRSRSEIIAQVLTTALEPEGVTKTKIMYKAYLSYSQLREYMALVLENGLLETADTNKYRTTNKGVNVLETYRHMNDLAGVQLGRPRTL